MGGVDVLLHQIRQVTAPYVGNRSFDARWSGFDLGRHGVWVLLNEGIITFVICKSLYESLSAVCRHIPGVILSFVEAMAMAG